MTNQQFEMVAKTLYGLEDVLADELIALGAEKVEKGRRMVSFAGDKAMLYKANFYCRTALRILKPIAHFKANNADAVYNEVKSIEWDKFISPDKTFAVDAVIYSENFNHSKFVAYRTKDAIADYFNDKFDKRPSVRISNPDIYINIHISHDDCTVSIDSSGESLYKRGYRVSQVDAPLNEVLAAGMILKTGWHGESNFIDPMCGSGTLLIEAAMIALNIAPGVYRKEFAFERWSDFDQDLFDEIYNDESSEREFKFKCYGSDISPMAIEKANKNIRSAGLAKYIELEIKPFQQLTEAPNPGIMVTNPPYGERISTDNIMELYSMIGERLKHVFTGYNAWILSYKDECFDKIGLRPKQRIKLMNGELECEYRCYELFSGTNKEYKTANKGKGERDYKEKGEREKEKGERYKDRGEREKGKWREEFRGKGERGKEKGERFKDRGERSKRWGDDKPRGDGERGKRREGFRERGEKDKGKEREFKGKGERYKVKGEREKEKGERFKDRGERSKRWSDDKPRGDGERGTRREGFRERGEKMEGKERDFKGKGEKKYVRGERRDNSGQKGKSKFHEKK